MPWRGGAFSTLQYCRVYPTQPVILPFAYRANRRTLACGMASSVGRANEFLDAKPTARFGASTELESDRGRKWREVFPSIWNMQIAARRLNGRDAGLHNAVRREPVSLGKASDRQADSRIE